MKKLIGLLVAGAIVLNGVFAQDEGETLDETAQAPAESSEEAVNPEEAAPKESNWPAFLDMSKADVTTGMGKQRTVELFGAQMGASNSWFGFDEILDLAKNRSVDNLENFLNKGELKLEGGASVLPALSVRIGFKKFGLKIATGATASLFVNGSQGLVDSIKNLKGLADGLDFNGITNCHTPQDIINFINDQINPIENTINNLGGSLSANGEAYAFIDAMADMAILNKKLWLRFGPSFFVPVFYMPNAGASLGGKANIQQVSDIDPTNPLSALKNSNIELKGDLEGLVAYGFDGLGVDLTAEARYAIFPILDAGLEVSHIPFIPAFADADLKLDGYVNTQIGLDNLNDISLNEDFKLDDSSGEDITILRPLRFDFYGIIKPFSSNFLTVRPNMGFSWKYPAAGKDSYTTFNTGIEATVNLPIILSATLGFRILEDVYSNYINLGFNLVIFELDIGASLRGTNIPSSWTMKGVAGYVGIKI